MRRDRRRARGHLERRALAAAQGGGASARRVPVEVRTASGGAGHAPPRPVAASPRTTSTRTSSASWACARTARARRPLLGRVIAGRAPRERAGLREGDRVVAIDGKPVATWVDFTAAVRASAGKPLDTRGASAAASACTCARCPRPSAQDEARVGLLGVERRRGAARGIRAHDHHGALRPARRARQGRAEGLGPVVFSLQMLGRMIVGDVSWKNLSGPITIADYAGQSAQLGWVTCARLPRAREREPRRAQSAARFRCWMGDTWCIISPKS